MAPVDLPRTSGVDHADRQPLVRNRHEHPPTQLAARYIVGKSLRTAAHSVPTLGPKCAHPHKLRRSAASRFLHAGVDIVTISRWMVYADPPTARDSTKVDRTALHLM